MTTLHPINPQFVASYKAVRLRALRDTPNAFGSTYLRESHFSEAEWLERAGNLSSERGMGYLAFCDGEYGGIAGCLLHEDDPLKATVVGMWVAPEQRKAGVGRLLLETIEAWARERGVQTLLLMVNDTNHAALALYSRIGFLPTGRTEPYINDPALVTAEMSKALATA